jgi:cell division protein FtsB
MSLHARNRGGGGVGYQSSLIGDLNDEEKKEKKNRKTCLYGFLVLLALLALAAFVIGLITIISHFQRTDHLNDENASQQDEINDLSVRVSTLENETIALTNIIETLREQPPIHGLMYFWWSGTSASKHIWARFNETTGARIGDFVPYAPSEARDTGPLGQTHYTRGPNPNDMVYLVYTQDTEVQYIMRHNPAAGTYNRTYLGALPVDHNNVNLVDYDPLNNRYLGLVNIFPLVQYKHSLVTIDINTGVISPLTGTVGPFAPLPTNPPLDMEVIGEYVMFSERYDDDYTNTSNLSNRLIFHNSTTGAYLTNSFHNGSYIAYPGSLLSSNLEGLPTGFFVRWYTAMTYDPSTFRLYVVIGVSSAGFQRETGWIQGTSEQDLLQKLMSGNYDIHITQHQTPFQLNGAVFLTPAV